jgi:type I restriction enzyme S subunit
MSTVGAVAKCITGNTPPKNDPEYYGDFMPFVKPTQLLDGAVSDAPEKLSEKGAKVARVLEPNSVLVSCIGNLGKTAINGRKVAFNQQINAAVFNEGVEPKYGFYFFQSSSARRQLENLSSATTIAIVNKSKFQSVKIPIAPLPEQRRIVARIEELFSRLDAGVAALRHAKAQLQRYRQSVLAAAVTGQLTQAWREQKVAEASRLSSPDKNQRQDASATLPYESAEDLLKRILEQRREQWDGRGKYKEPLGYSGENPFDTPPTWALANFEQVSRRVTVGHVGSMKDEYTESGVPFLRGQNVRANRFDPNGLKFVSREFHLSLSKSLIRGGDIAVTRSGDVGIACVIPDELGEANCSDLVLIQGPVLLNPNFAAYYMNSLGRRLVRAGKVGVAITHFNTQAVAAMPLPLPPLAEQHQIVAEVEARTTAIDHLEAELDRQITRSNRLRQSILASAFTGKLVPKGTEVASRMLS